MSKFKEYIKLLPPDDAGNVVVHYRCGHEDGSAFHLRESVSPKVAGIIEKAIEYGKQLRSDEIRSLLELE